MKLRLFSFVVSFLCLVSASAIGDGATATATTSDPQAVAILTQALVAAGGAQAVGSIQDFTASGSITYFWAGQEVQGPATVKGRGPDQFRIDAVLPSSDACVGCPGTRSYAVSHGFGALKQPDGTLIQPPYHNTINIGMLSLPYTGIAAALTDPLTTASYVGAATVNGHQTNQVRVQRNFSPLLDPDSTLSNLRVTDYFVDTQTNLVVSTVDMTHPTETFTRSYSHEIDLEGYAGVNGIQVPMTVTEKVDGQTISQLTLSSLTFNVGLTDADFQLQ